MPLILLFRIIKDLMNVRSAIMKRGIQEAKLRHLHPKIALFIQKAQGFLVIAEAFLHLHHRADAAHHEGIHILAGILHVDSVRASSRHIIDAVRKDDQMPSRQIQMLQNVREEFVVQLLIRVIRLQHPEHHGLLAARLLLLQRKLHREEVLSDFAGQGLPEKLTVLLKLLLLQRPEGLLQLRDDGPVLSDKASCHPVDDAAVLGHCFSDFLNFLTIHFFFLLFLCVFFAALSLFCCSRSLRSAAK